MFGNIDCIYYCLCQILISKLNNSVVHTCVNCATRTISACDELLLGKNLFNKPNDCDRWTFNIVGDCIKNLSLEERTLLEEEQNQQVPAKKIKLKSKKTHDKKGLAGMLK